YQASFEMTRQNVKGALSDDRINALLASAVTLKQSADTKFEERNLDEAMAAYKNATNELDAVRSRISDEETRLQAENKEAQTVFESRLDAFMNQVLAEDLFSNELSAIQAEMAKAQKTQKWDMRAAFWPRLSQALSEHEAAYKIQFSNLEKTANKLKEQCGKLIGKLRDDELTKRAPQASELRSSMDSLYTVVLNLHTDEKNKQTLISKWSDLEKELEASLLQLNTLREKYKTQAEDAKREFNGAFDALVKKYGNLIPGQYDKADTKKETAARLMLSDDHYNAYLVWVAAGKELNEAEKALASRAKELAQTRDTTKHACLTKRNAILSVKDIDGMPFLENVDRLKKAAEHKNATADLAECVNLWEQVAEELSKAERQHKLAIEAYKKAENAARLNRRQEIKRISITYPGEYDRINTHPLAKGLLDKVTAPKKLLASVTPDADDKATWTHLTAAESVLKTATKELEKRITAHLEEQRTTALAMQKDYTERVDKILAVPYAHDLVKTAEEHATLAKQAMSVQKYETAAFAWKDAQPALTTAEAQLAELNRNDALRKAAMEKIQKTKIATCKTEFNTIADTLSKDKTVIATLNKPAALADKAEAIAKTGTTEDTLKAWQAALLSMKQVEAEVTVREKAKHERELALKRKLEGESIHAKQAFKDKREILVKSPFAKGRLGDADKLAGQAEDAMKNNLSDKAVTSWKLAMDKLEDLENDLQADLKTQAEKMRDDVLKQRKVTAQWEEWDPGVGEKLVAYDVTMAMVRDLMDQQEFMNAGKQLVKCKEILGEIETFVQEKFVAKPGNDLILGEVGMQFRWLKDLNVWVGVYEVTNEQYRKFKPTHSSRKHEGLTLNGDTQPVCWISYYDALAYCTWLTMTASMKEVLPTGYKFRLPTKKEWVTYATCDNPSNIYPWGNKWPAPYGNFANRELFGKAWNLRGYTDEFPVTAPVSKSGKNDWGLYGVAGNVWEWTADKYNGKFAVFGGAWSSVDKRLLQVDLDNQNYADPQKDYDNIGFRVVLEPAED
ncbi:hypothetical protein BVX99_02445, partial [bacterium F16]